MISLSLPILSFPAAPNGEQADRALPVQPALLTPSAVRQQVWSLLSGMYPRGQMAERRFEQRFPYPHLLYLTPLAEDGVDPAGRLDRRGGQRPLGKRHELFSSAADGRSADDRLARGGGIAVAELPDRHLPGAASRGRGGISAAAGFWKPARRRSPSRKSIGRSTCRRARRAAPVAAASHRALRSGLAPAPSRRSSLSFSSIPQR